MIGSSLVSIVIPAYNAARYISDTLDSVLAQTHSNWELIVVNDSSTDNTQSIVEAYVYRDHRVSLFNLKLNFGAPAGPRNVGVRQARGSWVAFLDADDIWHPEKLSLQLFILMKTSAKFCSTGMVNFRLEPRLQPSGKVSEDFEWISFRKQLIKFRTPTSSVIVDRELLLKFPFNETMEYKAREDLDCWLHCHEKILKSVKIRAPLVGYRVVDGQISGKKFQMLKRHFFVLRNYRFLSGDILPISGAFLFTCTHFLFSIYYRLIKRVL